MIPVPAQTRVWLAAGVTDNCAERAMKSVALGRKDYLFVGSEGGGEGAAIAYTRIETASSTASTPRPGSPIPRAASPTTRSPRSTTSCPGPGPRAEPTPRQRKRRADQRTFITPVQYARQRVSSPPLLAMANPPACASVGVGRSGRRLIRSSDTTQATTAKKGPLGRGEDHLPRILSLATARKSPSVARSARSAGILRAISGGKSLE